MLTRRWYDESIRAAKKFRRIEKASRKEFNQKFWWKPGEPLPERAPDLAAVVE